ncbi:MAG: uracil-DNA glycosylase [Candidatus Pacebacteria bacterium]|nr:uracil-DNA glycosylase [Candidatus Paceibacterota bacterium]
MKDIVIEKSWKKKLEDEFDKEYFQDLKKFVHEEYATGKTYPHPKNIFRALNTCSFDEVKVVILGQDPYHGEGQANGLCFAVNEGMRLPPSLQNIFKEMESDLGHSVEKTGDLERWAKQGVLLLNSTLTVRSSDAGSHQGKGWEEFTDAVIQKLSTEREGVVFMLWGNYAKEKGKDIDWTKHLVLKAAHPSPFSAYNGFFGCKHFSQANEYLKKKGEKIIEW